MVRNARGIIIHRAYSCFCPTSTRDLQLRVDRATVRPAVPHTRLRRRRAKRCSRHDAARKEKSSQWAVTEAGKSRRKAGGAYRSWHSSRDPATRSTKGVACCSHHTRPATDSEKLRDRDLSSNSAARRARPCGKCGREMRAMAEFRSAH